MDHFRDDLVRWFSHNKRDFPWRRPGLSPWQALLVEMCLHRTKAEQVARIADELLTLGETPASFLSNTKKLAPGLASLGLHWRSANLTSAAEFVGDQLAGQVPDNWQELKAIPGVGDYIASAVLCFAFRSPQCADGHKHDENSPPSAGEIQTNRAGGSDFPCTNWLDPRERMSYGTRHCWTWVRWSAQPALPGAMNAPFAPHVPRGRG